MTIEDIINNKRFLRHDLRTPVNRVLVESFTTALESIKPKYGQIRHKCEVLLGRGEVLDKTFSSSWYDEKSSDEGKLADYLSKANAFYNDVIPLFEEDKKLLDSLSRFHFGDSHKDQMNYDSVKQIGSIIPFVIEALEQLIHVEDEEVNIARVNILSMIQKVFDPVWIADVEYSNVYKFSTIYVMADAHYLSYYVLNNIRENIERHAFGTKRYKDVLHFNNIIQVSYEIDGNTIKIDIANNGTEFEGDPQKLFTDGYCFGENKNTGHGLASALRAMKAMGGDLNIELHPKNAFPFSYILTLPVSL